MTTKSKVDFKLQALDQISRDIRENTYFVKFFMVLVYLVIPFVSNMGLVPFVVWETLGLSMAFRLYKEREKV